VRRQGFPLLTSLEGNLDFTHEPLSKCPPRAHVGIVRSLLLFVRCDPPIRLQKSTWLDDGVANSPFHRWQAHVHGGGRSGRFTDCSSIDGTKRARWRDPGRRCEGPVAPVRTSVPRMPMTRRSVGRSDSLRLLSSRDPRRSRRQLSCPCSMRGRLVPGAKGLDPRLQDLRSAHLGLSRPRFFRIPDSSKLQDRPKCRCTAAPPRPGNSFLLTIVPLYFAPFSL
jgi:hypothetical protein